jgi:multidrug efflux system membrane fusion protein
LPVAGPPSADPATATSDLFYALQAPGGAVRPGERVSVQLPLMGAEQALVVPTSAIVYDINGGAWVYEATSATTFVRRRIEIRSQAGTRTSIARGLDAGKQVVTAGTAELFGTEFGAGK